jgi:hypothetical protein
LILQRSTEHFGCSGPLFLGSSPRLLDSLICHDLLPESTFMSLVGVENSFHNVLVVGSCGTLLVLCLVLHLYIDLHLLVVRCTKVPGYTLWGYIVVAHYYIAATHYCMVVVPSSTEVHLVLSSFLLAPYKYLKFFLSLAPSYYNPYHHDPLTCKNCNMNFWVLSYTSTSLNNDMYHAHVFYKSHTMVLLLEKGLVLPFPYTARNLDIHSYGVLMSCIGYTKQLLFSLYPYSS